MKTLASSSSTQAYTATQAKPAHQYIFKRVGIAIALATLPLSTLVAPGSAVITAYLRLGSSGSQVFELQERLNRLGYRVRVDGRFDNNTREAVQAYQRACGLAVDGIVGSDTRTRLNNGDRCGGRYRPDDDFDDDFGDDDFGRGDRRWVVLVPTDDPDTLRQIQRYNGDAFINYSDRFGPYIQVGAFDDKYRAERLYRRLQKNYGIRDAHMRYQPI
jgi:hypothetical protein